MKFLILFICLLFAEKTIFLAQASEHIKLKNTQQTYEYEYALQNFFNQNHQDLQDAIKKHDDKVALRLSNHPWIKLNFTREVAPHLTKEGFVTQDELIFTIDLYHYLDELKSHGLISSDSNIKFAAGMIFQIKLRERSYSHTQSQAYLKPLINPYHHHNNAENGLGEEYFIEKKTLFHFDVASYVTVPLNLAQLPFSLEAGIHLQKSFEKENRLYQSDEVVDLQFEEKRKILLITELQVQLDLLKIIKVTLLRTSFRYEEQRRSFAHFRVIKSDAPINQFKEAKNHFWQAYHEQNQDAPELRPYIKKYEDTHQEEIGLGIELFTRGMVSKNSQTITNVITPTDQYKHTEIKKIKAYTHQNWLSRLVSKLFKKYLNMSTKIKNMVLSYRSLSLEYKESLKNPIYDYKFHFERGLVLNKNNYSRAKWFLDRWQFFKPGHSAAGLIRAIKNKQLVPPIKAYTKVSLSEEKLNELINLHEEKLWESFLGICRSRRKAWLNPRRREKMLTRFQVGRSACVKRLGIKLKKTKEPTLSKEERIIRYQEMLSLMMVKARSLDPIMQMLGDYLVVETSFHASTAQGLPFDYEAIHHPHIVQDPLSI